MTELNIKIEDKKLPGDYTNFVLSQFTPEEFVLDFCNIVNPQPVHVRRIITSPGHLKRIVTLLSSQIAEYEKQNGKIDVPTEPNSKIGFATE